MLTSADKPCVDVDFIFQQMPTLPKGPRASPITIVLTVLDWPANWPRVLVPVKMLIIQPHKEEMYIWKSVLGKSLSDQLRLKKNKSETSYKTGNFHWIFLIYMLTVGLQFSKKDVRITGHLQGLLIARLPALPALLLCKRAGERACCFAEATVWAAEDSLGILLAQLAGLWIFKVIFKKCWTQVPPLPLGFFTDNFPLWFMHESKLHL